MADVRLTSNTGADVVVATAEIDAFRSSLRGELLRPADQGYDAGRRVWNGMVDRRPGLIARCTGAADVIDSVNFARAHRLLIAVRGGGHNVAGHATCDGGLVIDLSRMKGVRVDPRGRVARADGGVLWGELDRETQAFGLVTPGGIVSTTGIAGLTLGGGWGWTSRKYGLACDNLLSADLVTADGTFVTASADSHADLFWGLRGGGGNFGVVTSFEYRLHPLGPMVLAGRVFHAFEKAREVLRFYREFTRNEPEDLACYAGLGTSPDGELLAAIQVCYHGSLVEGERVLRPLRAFGPPLIDQIVPMTYVGMQKMQDAFYRPGLSHYWKSSFLADLSDEAFETMIAHYASRPSALCRAAIEEVGGAVSRRDPSETAFTHRDRRYNLLLLGISLDPNDADKCIRWVRDFWEAMQPFSSNGVYVNYLGQAADEGEGRVRAAYGPEQYARLVALKDRYDPTNLFRLNQNVEPTRAKGQP